MLDQLLLIVKGVLEAEQDTADDADDDHHADDDERGRHNQDQQSQVIISKKKGCSQIHEIPPIDHHSSNESSYHLLSLSTI